MRRLLTTLNPEDEKLLRRKAKRVKNVQSTEVILGIQEMKRIAHEWEAKTGQRCEGLAATQIGWNARVIILRETNEPKSVAPDPAAFAQDDVNQPFDAVGYAEACAKHKEWNRVRGGVYDPWIVMINPVVVQSEGFQNSVEGCLSVPGSTYKVVRPTHVAFKYMRPNGTNSGVHLARGENAVKFDHEFGHLDGKLLPDVALEAYVGDSAEEPL